MFELDGRFVDVRLFDGSKLGSQTITRLFVDLPFRERLVGLANVAVQIADNFGNLNRIAGIDLQIVLC